MPNGKIGPQTGNWVNSWLPVSSFNARLDAWSRGLTTPAAPQNQPPAVPNVPADNAGNRNNGPFGGNAG